MSAVSIINTVWRRLVISGDEHNADFEIISNLISHISKITEKTVVVVLVTTGSEQRSRSSTSEGAKFQEPGSI